MTLAKPWLKLTALSNIITAINPFSLFTSVCFCWALFIHATVKYLPVATYQQSTRFCWSPMPITICMLNLEVRLVPWTFLVTRWCRPNFSGNLMMKYALNDFTTICNFWLTSLLMKKVSLQCTDPWMESKDLSSMYLVSMSISSTWLK